MLFNDSELTQPSYLLIQSVINTAYAWVRDPCVTAPQSVLFIYYFLSLSKCRCENKPNEHLSSAKEEIPFFNHKYQAICSVSEQTSYRLCGLMS